jgi:hypothetical protein
MPVFYTYIEDFVMIIIFLMNLDFIFHSQTRVYFNEDIQVIFKHLSAFFKILDLLQKYSCN